MSIDEEERAALAAHAAATEAQLSAAHAENDEVRAELAARATQLSDVYASTSWRVSAPVRLAGRQAGRLSRGARSGSVCREAGDLARSLAAALVRRGRRPAAPPPADDQTDRPTIPSSPTGESNSLHERYPQYEIGRWTYGDLAVHAWSDEAMLRIGVFCSIAPGVQIILSGEHRSDWVTTFPFNRLWESAKHISSLPKTKGDVVIGNDVWIGTEATIMFGVTIGDGAVVGARSLVAKDVEPYVVVAGNPARVVRSRFDDHLVERLLQIKWWDLDDEAIAELLPWLLAADTEAFVRQAESRQNANAG